MSATGSIGTWIETVHEGEGGGGEEGMLMGKSEGN